MNTCNICNKRFVNKYSLSAHKSRCHPKSKKIIPSENKDHEEAETTNMNNCNICNKRFANKNSLASHKSRYHPKSKNIIPSGNKDHEEAEAKRESEEFDTAQELGGNHKDSAKLVNAEEEKRTEQDSKRRRIDVLESNSIAGIVPAIEPFTARCVKRVFFQKVLSNRPKARVLFSIEQLLFIEAVTNNNNMDDVCRLLEENLNVLLQIIVYVYMF